MTSQTLILRQYWGRYVFHTENKNVYERDNKIITFYFNLKVNLCLYNIYVQR